MSVCRSSGSKRGLRVDSLVARKSVEVFSSTCGGCGWVGGGLRACYIIIYNTTEPIASPCTEQQERQED